VIRQRGGTTRRRDEQEDEPATVAQEIGSLLRGARERQGLDLLAVHDRLSRPITLLEALEWGDLARLPDQALALNTLRRYAALVGLDGDALALRMIDAWANVPAASPGPGPGDTGAPVTNVLAAVTTGPDHLRAFTQTGQVPRVGAGSTAAVGGYGYDVATGPPTGTFPVVPRQELRQSKRAVAKARRRLRAPRPLKIATWVTAGLLVVVLVGTGILQQRPTWLVSAHILRTVEPAGTQTGGGTHGAKPPVQASPVVQTSSASQSAAYSVSTSDFVVEITTTNKCWVQIISSASPKPVAEGIQPAGMHLGYPAAGIMTVEVGDSAVVVGIAVRGKVVFYDAPRLTPFTYTFTPVGHTTG
jgi:hypothetical protein